MPGLTESLAALHKLHSELATVNEELARGPRQIKLREQKIAGVQTEANSLKEELKQTRAAADRKSLDLKSLENKLADLRAKLNACSSNREYEVLKGQIEADEVAKSVAEDEILELLEQVDRTQRAIVDTETKAKTLKDECTEFTTKINAAAVGLQTQAKDLTTRIAGSEPQLATEPMLRYRRLVEAHQADALASVDAKGVCSQCFVTLTPQAHVQVKAGQAMFCSNCGRLLYAAT
jgi:predicted  nucleic acid-binding Zn-ribbon protein